MLSFHLERKGVVGICLFLITCSGFGCFLIMHFCIIISMFILLVAHLVYCINVILCIDLWSFSSSPCSDQCMAGIGCCILVVT